MMPQDVGGVVSPKLVVYGTKNLRVIDASILPMQVCGHLTSTLYAIAEKAADIIKADISNSTTAASEVAIELATGAGSKLSMSSLAMVAAAFAGCLLL